MFITKLNKLFEKHGKIAFIIMFFVIIGPFVLIVGPTSLTDAFQTDHSVDTVKIDGKTYTENKLLPYIKMVRYQRFITGTNTSEEDFILPAAVEYKLLLDYADEIGISEPSDEEIRNSIRSQVYYQDPETGKFSQQYFEYFKARLLYDLQISPREYDKIMANILILRKLEESIAQKIANEIEDKNLEDAYQKRNSTLEFYYKNYTRDDFLEMAKNIFDKKNPTQEAKNAVLESYFKEHIEPLRSVIEKELVRKAEDKDFQYKGNDAVFAASETYINEIQKNKDLTVEQKTAKIQAMNDQLSQYGIPFFRHEQKQISYIFFPIENATDISLEKQMDMYNKTKDTYFKGKTQEEALKQISEILGREKGTENAKNLAITFNDKLYEHFKQSSNIEISFKEIAQTIGKEVKTSSFFDDINEVGAIEDLQFRSEVYRLISKDMPVSQPILGNKGYYIAVWKQTIPAYLPAFDLTDQKLITKIANQIQEKDALDLAQNKGKEDFAKIEKCPPTEIVGKAEALKLEKKTGTRQTPPYEVYPQSLLTSLNNQVGATYGTSHEEGFSIVYLLSIKPVDAEVYAKEKASFKETYTQEKAQEAHYLLIESLYQQHKVEFLRKSN